MEIPLDPEWLVLKYNFISRIILIYGNRLFQQLNNLAIHQFNDVLHFSSSSRFQRNVYCISVGKQVFVHIYAEKFF